jgi:glycosyltransferase involved in cell wall biosynthesis
VVFAYTIKPVTFGMIAAKLAFVPKRFGLITGLGYLFIDDGSRRQRLVRSVAWPLMRLGTSCSTAIFVQNPDDARDLRAHRVVGRHTPIRRFWGSGVDMAEFERRPLPGGRPVFLMVARLLRDKGVCEFVEAARIVKRAHPDARFLLVGPPDPNPAGVPLEQVEGWRREGVVEVVGGVDDVRPYLEACHVFVLPSYREGTPRSVLEAMAVGRAIITTDAPGCRTTVEVGVNGFLVPPRTVESLARYLTRYLNDRSLLERHGEGSAALVEERFDVRRVNAAMLDAMGL